MRAGKQHRRVPRSQAFNVTINTFANSFLVENLACGHAYCMRKECRWPATQLASRARLGRDAWRGLAEFAATADIPHGDLDRDLDARPRLQGIACFVPIR